MPPAVGDKCFDNALTPRKHSPPTIDVHIPPAVTHSWHPFRLRRFTHLCISHSPCMTFPVVPLTAFIFLRMYVKPYSIKRLKFTPLLEGRGSLVPSALNPSKRKLRLFPARGALFFAGYVHGNDTTLPWRCARWRGQCCTYMRTFTAHTPQGCRVHR